MVTTFVDLDAVLKDAAPHVLAALLRRDGDLAGAEDAVQDALMSAAVHWPNDGIPANPAGWLYTVAARRRVDAWRSDLARYRRERTAAALEPELPPDSPTQDDTLLLLFLCCHPALQPASQVALTLRAVGGLSTAEIASAFLLPEQTIARRISRAKQRVRAAGARFVLPDPDSWHERLSAVMHVLYLSFNEGYATSTGAQLRKGELTAEAIRLGQDLRQRLPDDGEVAGLLALMLLTEARREARTSAEGELVPLAEQDRALWDHDAIREGVALVSWALSNCKIGPYQVQAAISAVHCEAASTTDTDWSQIVGLYTLLDRLAPGPMVKLARTIAIAKAEGPASGLAVLNTYAADPATARHYRHDAVRGYLMEQLDEAVVASELYRRASQRTLSLPERRYLERQSRRLGRTSDLGGVAHPRVSPG